LRYNANQEEVFLGHSVTQHKNMSDATAKIIDEEIRSFVDEGERSARRILTEHLADLETVAKGLLEYETLSRDDIETLLRGEPVVRDSDGNAKPKEPSRRSSVPSSGTPQPGSFGTGPEPQPGA
jgi:cell division protease FtsH